MKTIGKLAKESGVGVETVRFYERKGLIIKPARSTRTSFRAYSDDDVRRIKFIKKAQELGFTLREIKDLLGLDLSPKAKCGDLGARAVEKLNEVNSKLRDLRRMQRSLKELIEICGRSGEKQVFCRILDCFDGQC